MSSLKHTWLNDAETFPDTQVYRIGGVNATLVRTSLVTNQVTKGLSSRLSTAV